MNSKCEPCIQNLHFKSQNVVFTMLASEELET